MYNITNITSGNETGLLTLVQGVNEQLVFGQLGNMFMVGLFALFFISFQQTTGETGRSFMATSFICFVIAMPLVALNLVHPYAILFTLIMSAIGVAMNWKE